MPAHAMSLNEAIMFFVKCQRPDKCLKHYMLFKNFYKEDDEQLVTLTRGCISKMYHTQYFQIKSVKDLFWDEVPVETNPPDYSLTVSRQCLFWTSVPLDTMCFQEMIQNWEANVGPVESTLHWVGEDLYYHIHCMQKMSLETLQNEFREQRDLDRLATGVMDVLFLSSCFKLPSVVAMGPCFWVFARELIQLKLSSVDHLNSLLWGLVLPQTVIVLEPKKYALDSLLDPIAVPLTIRGQKDDQGVTTVEVHSQTSLIFFHNTRLHRLRFVQAPSVSVPSTDFLVKFCGFGGCKLTAFMVDVEFVCAGYSVQNYLQVQCNHVHVSRAAVGLSAYSVERLSILGCDSEVMCEGHTGFNGCGIGIQIMDVDHLLVENQVFSGTEKIFHACVKTSSEVKDSNADACVSMGVLLMARHFTPVFIDFEVFTFCVCGSHTCVLKCFVFY